MRVHEEGPTLVLSESPGLRISAAGNGQRLTSSAGLCVGADRINWTALEPLSFAHVLEAANAWPSCRSAPRPMIQVLIVDDDPGVRDLVCHEGRQQGWSPASRHPRSAGRVMESFTHPVNRINHLIPRHALGEVTQVHGFQVRQQRIQSHLIQAERIF